MKLLIIAYLSLSLCIFSVTRVAAQEPSPLKWGAYIKSLDGHDPPWDWTSVDSFEDKVGKKMSVFHWGTAWYAKANYWPYDGYVPFQPKLMDVIRERGYIPFFDWASEIGGQARLDPEQSTISLSRIVRGDRYGVQCDNESGSHCTTYDDYIRQFALDAKDWNHPFYLRFDWEMNGDWFPWSEKATWNKRGQYVQAWRHVHDIFTSVGADNVMWVWCPNIATDTTIPLSDVYPGDAYVDWVCLDVYNKNNPWLSFHELLSGSNAGVQWLHDSYQEITTLAPSKPLAIGEMASGEARDGGQKKADWIREAWGSEILHDYPRIRLVLWFNWDTDAKNRYTVDSSAASLAAFRDVIGSPLYQEVSASSSPRAWERSLDATSTFWTYCITAVENMAHTVWAWIVR